MKRVRHIFAIFCAILASLNLVQAQPLQGQKENPPGRNGNSVDCLTCQAGEINADAYASLSNAISAVGATPRTLTVSSAKAISTSLTIPNTVTLRLTGNGQIAVAAGATLTINGPLDAPLRQIFSGSGSVKFTNAIEKIYPRWFGSKEDNSTDDTAAIQAAIDAYGRTSLPHAGGVVEILGGSVISSTLQIYNTSITIHGPGWGIGKEAPYRGFLRWNGPAGIPMLLFRDCYNSGPDNIRLIGKSTAKPSAAVEYKRSLSATVQADNNFARHLWVGNYFGYDSDNARQFSAGILFSGAVDNDTNYFEHISVVGCDIGIDIRNPNSSVTHFDNVGIGHCGIGARVGARVMMTNVNLGVNDLDFEMVAQVGRLILHNVTSEGAGQFAKLNVSSELYVEGWDYQVSAATPVSGIIIAADNGGSRLRIRNGFMTYVPGYSGATAKIRQRNSGGAGKFYLEIDNVTGLSKENLDLQTVGEGLSAQHLAIIRRPPNGAHDWGANDLVYLTNGDEYVEGRNDFASKVNVFGGPLRVRQIVAPSNVTATPTGSGATTYSYRVTAVSGSGESLASSAATCTNAGTLDSKHFNVISAYPSLGADAYRFYGRTGGSEQLLGIVYAYQISNRADNNSVISFKDNGSITPSGALPKINTTGHIDVEGGYSPDAGGLKHKRVTTGAISAGATADVTITWATAFVDTNYTLLGPTVEESTASLQVIAVKSKTASAVVVSVKNNDRRAAHTGVLHLGAIRD